MESPGPETVEGATVALKAGLSNGPVVPRQGLNTINTKKYSPLGTWKVSEDRVLVIMR
jgi:hypothetical protein